VCIAGGGGQKRLILTEYTVVTWCAKSGFSKELIKRPPLRKQAEEEKALKGLTASATPDVSTGSPANPYRKLVQ